MEHDYLYPQNRNPNYPHDLSPTVDPLLNFEFFDFPSHEYAFDQDLVSQNIEYFDNTNSGTNLLEEATSSVVNKDYENGMKRNKDGKKGSRVAIRFQSEREIIDDGFKWRKYGKKKVKNSPNPRNYYKCSSEGCKVKKRVERDGEDSSYVITTYDGVHNHESPCVVYNYTATPITPIPYARSLHSST